MIQLTTPTQTEWERYHPFKPSVFQRIVWFFWPTMLSLKWERYRQLKKEDCLDI